MEKIKLGISTCLLGEKVRYDGGHKLDHFIVDTLGNYVDFVSVCPEVECGLSIPREAMRLVGDPKNPKLITQKTNKDITPKMLSWSKQKIEELKKEDLCGFIFKSKSPSSGMERVKIYNEKGYASKVGVGIFAREFIKNFPMIPVEEEGRLHDVSLRENFIESIFVQKRWRELIQERKTVGRLVSFHSKHKFLILSHNQKIYRELGKIVADTKIIGVNKSFNLYFEKLVTAFKSKTSTSKHTNVILHMFGFFKKNLSKEEKEEFLEVLQDYKKNLIPLVVPVTLINHFAKKYKVKYLLDQYYILPHPLELKLRNHV